MMQVRNVWYQSEAGPLGSTMHLESHSQLNLFQSYSENNFIGGLTKPIN